MDVTLFVVLCSNIPKLTKTNNWTLVVQCKIERYWCYHGYNNAAHQLAPFKDSQRCRSVKSILIATQFYSWEIASICFCHRFCLVYFSWICIYPAYINSKKTRQQGRRLPKEHCVENPTCIEIRDVLSLTNLKIVVENKQYCREKSRVNTNVLLWF